MSDKYIFILTLENKIGLIFWPWRNINFKINPTSDGGYENTIPVKPYHTKTVTFSQDQNSLTLHVEPEGGIGGGRKIKFGDPGCCTIMNSRNEPEGHWAVTLMNSCTKDIPTIDSSPAQTTVTVTGKQNFGIYLAGAGILLFLKIFKKKAKEKK